MASIVHFGEPAEDEVTVWSVAVGEIPRFFKSKGCKQALQIIAKQKGLIGLIRVKPRGTLCLFYTENDAKIARNVMTGEGITCGVNICEVYINKRILDGKSKRDFKSGS